MRAQRVSLHVPQRAQQRAPHLRWPGTRYLQLCLTDLSLTDLSLTELSLTELRITYLKILLTVLNLNDEQHAALQAAAGQASAGEHGRWQWWALLPVHLQESLLRMRLPALCSRAAQLSLEAAPAEGQALSTASGNFPRLLDGCVCGCLEQGCQLCIAVHKCRSMSVGHIIRCTSNQGRSKSQRAGAVIPRLSAKMNRCGVS